jgi:hypothetical protein
LRTVRELRDGQAFHRFDETGLSLWKVNQPYKFARLYGAWPNFVVSGDPKLALRLSAERYLRAIGDRAPLEITQHSVA